MKITIKLRRTVRFGLSAFLALFVSGLLAQPFQGPATSVHSSAEHRLLLPPQIISGERATLAVLDTSGRLAPGVTVHFSNGDRVTTDKTGRALFVAPLDQKEISASIVGSNRRAKAAIFSAPVASADTPVVSTAPQFVAAGDRFELRGKGFCGDADANQVLITGKRALVLASSPLALTITPPPEVAPGRATLQLTCTKNVSAPFIITFLELDLRADSSPLKPGEHRPISVHIKGTTGRVPIEATNLSPNIAEMVGGNSVISKSSGGSENIARVVLIGKARGTFRVAIRVVPTILRRH